MNTIPEHLAKLAIELCGDANRVPWSEIKQALDDVDEDIENINLETELRNDLKKRNGWPVNENKLIVSDERYRNCVIYQCDKRCGTTRLGPWSSDLEAYAIELCNGDEDKVPWSEIKAEIDEMCKRARETRRQIAAKNRELKRLGKPYNGGGLLELCRYGGGDYYLCVRKVCKRHVKLPAKYASPEHSDSEYTQPRDFCNTLLSASGYRSAF